MPSVEDAEFQTWLSGELASLPGVLAVALGGSRAQGTHHPGSDWDYAVYYRGSFDPDSLRAKGWPGRVVDIGGWGGGAMNGGAWLTVDGRRVDVHYRDLAEVEHWCAEAVAGRFNKEPLLFYTAGIPTYVVMGELACNNVLVGELPLPTYPEALASQASSRWHHDAELSVEYAANALATRSDITVALANASRALIEAAHSVLASRRQWVLNEKGIVERAGLAPYADLLLDAHDPQTLAGAIARIAEHLEQ
jgi:predicted nucleotidyltransferase